MTSKLNFVISACDVFNCTPGTVLNAMRGEVTMQRQLADAIRKAGARACSANRKEWKQFADLCDDENVSKIIWSMISGSDIKF